MLLIAHSFIYMPMIQSCMPQVRLIYISQKVIFTLNVKENQQQWMILKQKLVSGLELLKSFGISTSS